jgi:hypothetical protein
MWSGWWNENWQGKRSTLRKPTPLPFCPPQILHDLTWDRTDFCYGEDDNNNIHFYRRIMAGTIVEILLLSECNKFPCFVFYFSVFVSLLLVLAL